MNDYIYLKKQIMDIINGDNELKDEYLNNPLFHRTIDDIINTENCAEVMVNALFCYSKTLDKALYAIDKTKVPKVIEMFSTIAKDEA